jgi:hypothetical protein
MPEVPSTHTTPASSNNATKNNRLRIPRYPVFLGWLLLHWPHGRDAPGRSEGVAVAACYYSLSCTEPLFPGWE